MNYANNEVGANFGDEDHLRRSLKNWKRPMDAKRAEKKKTGNGRVEDFNELDEHLCDLFLGIKADETISVRIHFLVI